MGCESLTRLALTAATALAAGSAAQAAPQDEPIAEADDVAVGVEIPARMPREAIRASVDAAAGYLVREQHEDGSWGDDAPKILELGFALNTYRSWRISSHAISTMALAAVDETPERRAALDEAVRFLATAELPLRDSDWDIDFVWTSLYGFVACVELLGDERYTEGELADLLRARTEEFLTVLAKHQAASGGWAYYDDPPFDIQPTWATSFCTALVLPSLREAQGLGLDVPETMIERALRYLGRCALPNGAYTYDLDPVARINGVEHINRIEGSLGRTQVGNWARRTLGDRRVTDEVIREGLEALFEHHGFLDHVRLRPIPHEGFHANAGYFYFFAHYYAAKVIGLLPEDEREEWHARLRPHLIKTQRESGCASDFLGSSYTVNAGTSFLVLALEEGAGRPKDQ